jgi:hypothetical protein
MGLALPDRQSALLDHAAIGRNRPIAENVIDSKSIERAYSEKPASAFSQRALAACENGRRGSSLELRRRKNLSFGRQASIDMLPLTLT